jgi:hypothetical protein
MPTAVSCLPPALSRALVGGLVCFVLWLPGEAVSQERSAAAPGSSEVATGSFALSEGFAELVRHRSDDSEAPPAPAVDPHTAVFQTSMYPSAAECAA